MNGPFDLARANDRGYTPPQPWTLWDFASSSWSCIECRAPALSQLHGPTCELDDDDNTDDCRNKFSEMRSREATRIQVAANTPASTPVGALSDAPIEPISQVSEFVFPIPAVRCPDCPRGPSPVGPDGTWTCATCGAKAGPWRAVESRPQVNITNLYGSDSEKIVAAIASELANLRNVTTERHRAEIAVASRECNHVTFDAKCAPDLRPHPTAWRIGIVALTVVSVLAALAWYLR